MFGLLTLTLTLSLHDDAFCACQLNDFLENKSAALDEVSYIYDGTRSPTSQAQSQTAPPGPGDDAPAPASSEGAPAPGPGEEAPAPAQGDDKGEGGGNEPTL